MKLNIKFIFIFGVFLLSSNYIQCNQQIFDIIGKEIDKKHSGGKNSKSLFASISNTQNKNINLKAKENKSIFNDEINFSQVNEKLKNKNTIKNQNKNTNTKTNTNANKSVFSGLSKIQNQNQKSNSNNKSVFTTLSEKNYPLPSKSNQAYHPPSRVSYQNGPIHNNNNNNNNNSNNNKNTHLPLHSTAIPSRPIFTHPTTQHNEIEQLKTKEAILMELNSKITKKLKLKNKLTKKSKKVNEDIVSFIQTHEGKVNQIKNKLNSKTSAVKLNFSKKDTELSHLISNVNSNYEKLHKKLSEIKLKFESIREKESSKIKGLSEKLDVRNLNIKNKLDVDGTGFIKSSIYADNLDLGTLKINKEGVSLDNEKTRLIIGGQVLNMNDLMKNLEMMQKINIKCGEDLSKCKVITKKDLLESQSRQEIVLNNIQVLRRETEDIFNKRK